MVASCYDNSILMNCNVPFYFEIRTKKVSCNSLGFIMLSRWQRHMFHNIELHDCNKNKNQTFLFTSFS